MDMPQIDLLHAITAKAKMLVDAPIAILASSIIKDDEGQIKWSSIMTGGLTAGLIAAATSMFSMQQTLTELRTKYEGRAAQVEMIPAINERQRFVLEELAALRSEKAAATNDRFRGSDALRLEERLQRNIDALDRRIDDLERGKKR